MKTLRKVDVLLSLLLSKEQHRLILYTRRFHIDKEKREETTTNNDDRKLNETTTNNDYRDLIKLLPSKHPLNSQLLRELLPDIPPSDPKPHSGVYGSKNFI